MPFCKVLIPFTEYVPGKGMVVGNAGKTVELPIRYAAVRRERGYVTYDDADAAEEAAADAARPKSRIEQRLFARAQRRAERAARQAAASKPTPAAPTSRQRNARKSSDKSPLAKLRDEYKALVGKGPSPRLDADALAAKLAELKADPATLAAAKQPAARRSRAKKPAATGEAKPKRASRAAASTKKAPAVASDAPVD